MFSRDCGVISVVVTCLLLGFFLALPTFLGHFKYLAKLLKYKSKAKSPENADFN